MIHRHRGLWVAARRPCAGAARLPRPPLADQQRGTRTRAALLPLLARCGRGHLAARKPADGNTPRTDPRGLCGDVSLSDRCLGARGRSSHRRPGSPPPAGATTFASGFGYRTAGPPLLFVREVLRVTLTSSTLR